MTIRVATATGWVIRFIVSKVQPSFTSVCLSIFTSHGIQLAKPTRSYGGTLLLLYS